MNVFKSNMQKLYQNYSTDFKHILHSNKHPQVYRGHKMQDVKHHKDKQSY